MDMIEYEIPKAFTIWNHYKGERYMILGLAINTANGEVEVLYEAVYGQIKFTQNLGKFLGYAENHERRFTPDVVDPRIAKGPALTDDHGKCLDDDIPF